MKRELLIISLGAALFAHGCAVPGELSESSLDAEPLKVAHHSPGLLDSSHASPPPGRSFDQGVAVMRDRASPLPSPDLSPRLDQSPSSVADQSTPVRPDQAAPEPGFAPDSLRLLELVNGLRATGGNCGGQALPPVAPLQLHPLLEEAAQRHADDMAQNGYFDHQSQDGRNPGDRISEVGYRWSGYGENIAAGHRSVEAAFQGWVDSPGHCENMLRAHFEELGVGHSSQGMGQFSDYWVQKFATPQ